MTFVYCYHLHYDWQIVTDLRFVFTSVVLHAVNTKPQTSLHPQKLIQVSGEIIVLLEFIKVIIVIPASICLSTRLFLLHNYQLSKCTAFQGHDGMSVGFSIYYTFGNIQLFLLHFSASSLRGIWKFHSATTSAYIQLQTPFS